MLVWLARYIERHPALHQLALGVWRNFPPRLAGFLKGQFARSWVVGAVAVMVDEEVSPPEVLLVEHSYRRKGAWGLPGGALDSIPGDPASPGSQPSPDDVLESGLRREVWRNWASKLRRFACFGLTPFPMLPRNPDPTGRISTSGARLAWGSRR